MLYCCSLLVRWEPQTMRSLFSQYLALGLVREDNTLFLSGVQRPLLSHFLCRKEKGLKVVNLWCTMHHQRVSHTFLNHFLWFFLLILTYFSPLRQYRLHTPDWPWQCCLLQICCLMPFLFKPVLLLWRWNRMLFYFLLFLCYMQRKWL